MAAHSHRIVIVGGGAGGVELAVRLAKGGEDDILLIDRSLSHVWKPRLHEMAAGAWRSTVDAISYAGLAEHWGFAFEQGELAGVDPENKRLTLGAQLGANGHTLVPEREIEYRALVLAVGGVTPDLGVEGVLDYAMMLDFGIDAEALFQRFSAGLLARSLPGGGPFRVVIVGSGATGVELASYLVTDHLCASIAPPSAAPEIQVTILEGADTFMPGVTDEVREAVTQRLGKAGIEMKTGQQVNQISAGEVTTGDGNRFPADLAVWTTGRVGLPVAERIEALATNKKRQWIVRPTLQATASDAVFALGDCSYIEDNPVPPTAQAASEQAEHLARQLPQYLADAKPEPFEYKDKGTLLSLGEAGAIGSMRGFFSSDFQVRGRLARAAYRGLQRQHQYLLLGPVKGTAEVISDVFGRKVGPRLKVY